MSDELAHTRTRSAARRCARQQASAAHGAPPPVAARQASTSVTALHVMRRACHASSGDRQNPIRSMRRKLNQNFSGYEVYYTACSFLEILKNSCSKLHCQTGFHCVPFLYKIGDVCQRPCTGGWQSDLLAEGGELLVAAQARPHLVMREQVRQRLKPDRGRVSGSYMEREFV